MQIEKCLQQNRVGGNLRKHIVGSLVPTYNAIVGNVVPTHNAVVGNVVPTHNAVVGNEPVCQENVTISPEGIVCTVVTE